MSSKTRKKLGVNCTPIVKKCLLGQYEMLFKTEEILTQERIGRKARRKFSLSHVGKID